MSDDADEEKIRKAATEENELTDFLRAYTTDAHGNRVLAGLTPEETAEFKELRLKSLKDHLSDKASPYASFEERKAASARMAELQAKHDRGRGELLGAEHELRADKPTIN
jgi:hypothetical protein